MFILSPRIRTNFTDYSEKESLPIGYKSSVRDHHLNILWKGGHNAGVDATDVLFQPDRTTNFSVPVVGTPNTEPVVPLSSALLQPPGSRRCPVLLPRNKAQLYVSLYRKQQQPVRLSLHWKIYSRLKARLGELSLQYITAPKEGMTLCEQVEAVCQGGMRWIQLRMKGASLAEMLCEGRKVKRFAGVTGHSLLSTIGSTSPVSRKPTVCTWAKRIWIHGKPRRILGPGKIVGATCNTPGMTSCSGKKQQVDYIGLGALCFYHNERETQSGPQDWKVTGFYWAECGKIRFRFRSSLSAE